MTDTRASRTATVPRGDGGGAPEDRRARARRSRAGRVARLATVAAVVGLALGRFVLGPGDAGTGQAATQAEAPADPSAVVNQLEAATRARPDDAAGWQRLGVAYVGRAAQTGDPTFTDLAARAFDRADALAPQDFITLIGRGSLALSLHQFPDALELGRQAHEAAPFSAEALGVLVDAQVELGDYDAAAADLQRMLDVDPGLPALSRASYLRELNGDLPGAIRAMQQAGIAGSFNSYDVASVQALLGRLHFHNGDLEAAASALDRAEGALPGGVDAAIGRARLVAARGDVDAAVDELAPVVERTPRPDAAILLAELARAAGRDEQAADAEALVRTLLTLQAASGQDVDLELAVFEADRAERPDEAVRLARDAYDARPDNVFAADALAWSLHRGGDSAGAVRYAERAVRLDTADPLIHFHAASVFAGAGDDDRAREHLERVRSLTPWFSFAYLDEAGALADRLGVDAPAAWERR